MAQGPPKFDLLNGRQYIKDIVVIGFVLHLLYSETTVFALFRLRSRTGADS